LQSCLGVIHAKQLTQHKGEQEQEWLLVALSGSKAVPEGRVYDLYINTLTLIHTCGFYCIIYILMPFKGLLMPLIKGLLVAVTAFTGLLVAVRPTLCSKGKNGEQSRNQAIKKSCSHPKLHALLISWLLKRAGTEHDCVSSLLEALEIWG